MKSDRAVPVAIVGAGFSGTMVAAHLARLGVDSLLIEASDREGKGTAFSTTDPAHLLNVPAESMSAWPDAPDDFLSAVGAKAGDFVQRRKFGGYLHGILDDAQASGRSRRIRARAVSAAKREGGWSIGLDDGGSVEAEALVIAIGNQPPAPLRFDSDLGDKAVANPWGDQARAAIADAVANQSDVLIVGTGLTMVDVVLSLAGAGHEGRILALSRRGLAPRGHATGEPAPVDVAELPKGDVRNLSRWLRERARAKGWRAAIDALRPHSQLLWQGLPLKQQQRFIRHARPWWDVHRHRIAPQVARQLDDLADEGRLEILAGRIGQARLRGDSVDVTFRPRGDGESVTRSFGHVFNCTGPLHDIGRTQDPLLRNLLDSGLVEPDELRIGLAVDERSRSEGGDRLWTLGALTKGRFWEMIAVPDIRTQAATVAADIATELHR